MGIVGDLYEVIPALIRQVKGQSYDGQAHL